MKQLKKLGLLAIALIVASLSIVACSKDKEDLPFSHEVLVNTIWEGDYYNIESGKEVFREKWKKLYFEEEDRVYLDDEASFYYTVDQNNLFPYSFYLDHQPYRIEKYTGTELVLINRETPQRRDHPVKIVLRKIGAIRHGVRYFD